MASWSAPMTWVSGTNPTAAQFNAQIRDNETWLKDALTTHGITSDSTLGQVKAAVCGVHLGGSGTQSISNSSDTTLTWNTESYDTDAFHSTSSNTNRITIPAGLGGYYLIAASVRFEAATGGDRRVWVEDDGGTILARQIARGATSSYAHLTVGFIWPLAAGDWVSARVFQDSGGAIDVDKSVTSVFFQAHRIFSS